MEDYLKNIFTSNLNDVRGLIDAIENDLEQFSEDPTVEVRSKHDGAPYLRRFEIARRLFSYCAWDTYYTAAVSHYRKQEDARTDPKLTGAPVYQGQIDAVLNDQLRILFDECEQVPFQVDGPKGFAFIDKLSEKTQKQFDEMYCCYKATPQFSEHLSKILSGIESQVETVLGHYWSAAGYRIFAPRPGPTGSTNYHSDWYPPGLKKLYIYPDGAGPKQGSTVFELPSGKEDMIEGGPGVWAIFDSTGVRHRALSPQEGMPPRRTIELHVVPAMQNDTTVTENGVYFGFKHLPSDGEGELVGDGSSHTLEEVYKYRMYMQSLALAMYLSDGMEFPYQFRGFGF